jgi:hypothetical protein
LKKEAGFSREESTYREVGMFPGGFTQAPPSGSNSPQPVTQVGEPEAARLVHGQSQGLIRQLTIISQALTTHKTVRAEQLLTLKTDEASFQECQKNFKT